MSSVRLVEIKPCKIHIKDFVLLHFIYLCLSIYIPINIFKDGEFLYTSAALTPKSTVLFRSINIAKTSNKMKNVLTLICQQHQTRILNLDLSSVQMYVQEMYANECIFN